jgi:hypothetical protein
MPRSGAFRFFMNYMAILALSLSLLVCLEARSYEDAEAHLERSVNWNNRNVQDLLKGPGWSVYTSKEQHMRTKDLSYYVTYQLSWAFESKDCVGWNPTILITCTGDGKPVLISKGTSDNISPDCAMTKSAILCMIPIEESTSLYATIKQTDVMTFECRGDKESDLNAAVGLRRQDLICSGSESEAKQGLKMDVMWQNNMAYSFQCKTIDNVLTTFDDKGHCMSLSRAGEECGSSVSGSPCSVSLPKRYLTQIDDFFVKNPAAISQSKSVAPSAQGALWNTDSTPTSGSRVGSS